MVERHVANVIMGVRFSLPAHMKNAHLGRFSYVRVGAYLLRMQKEQESKPISDSFGGECRTKLS